MMSSGPGLHVVVFRSLLTTFGGAERTAVRAAVGLRARGYRVTFVARPPVDRRHDHFIQLRRAGIPVVALPHWHQQHRLRRMVRWLRPLIFIPYSVLRPKAPGKAWHAVSEIADTLVSRFERRRVRTIMSRLVADPGATVVHVYGQEGLTPLLAGWTRTRGVPLVYTESGEGDEVYAERFGLRGTIDVINEIPLVICCGPHVAANIRRVYGYTGKIVEIPFLIEDPDETILENRQNGRGPTVLGSVGRLVEHKRHRDIISAAAALHREGLDVRVLLGGDGPMRPQLAELARAEGIPALVDFVPAFDRVSDILARMDIFVLPSTSEGQPLAITEAMAHGVPVVASRFGGIPDQLEHGVNGLLVAPLAQDELVGALRALVTDKSRRAAMGSAARACYLRSRRASVVLDAIEQAYRQVRSPGACA